MVEVKENKPPQMHRRLWQFPWDYKESFLVAAGLLLTGYLLQVSTGSVVQDLKSPANYIIGLVFILMLILLHFTGKTNPLIKWLRSVPVSISALTMVLIQAVVMGTMPQQSFTDGVEPNIFGFTNVTSSWPFVISMVFVLINLGLATLFRMFPFHRKNLGFLLNHLGLWITLTAGILGAGDLQRLTMDLNEEQPEWRAKDEQKHTIEMPFAFNLKKFNMETFSPKLAFADITNNKVETKGVNALRMISKGDQYQQKGYTIKILDYLESSIFAGNRYHSVNETGAIPAALVQVKSTTIDTTAWVSCGSFATTFSILQLNDKLAIVMLQPEAKKFASDVEVFKKAGSYKKATIEVNKPLNISGWKVYQVSYDERFGKWSKLSVVELVRDPWLPVVYTGIFMMIAGAIYLIFKGRIDS